MLHWLVFLVPARFYSPAFYFSGKRAAIRRIQSPALTTEYPMMQHIDKVTRSNRCQQQHLKDYSKFNSQPSTLNSQLSTLNSPLSTLLSQLTTLNSQLSSLLSPNSTLTASAVLATIRSSTSLIPSSIESTCRLSVDLTVPESGKKN